MRQSQLAEGRQIRQQRTARFAVDGQRAQFAGLSRTEDRAAGDGSPAGDGGQSSFAFTTAEVTPTTAAPMAIPLMRSLRSLLWRPP